MIDEIRFDLLPKAFSKYSRIIGYIDAQRREIVIGTASGNQADEFLSSLRTAFGSLPVALLEPYVSAQLTMTQWAKNRQGPKRVQFGQEISLVDPAEGDKGTFRKQDLSSDEILQCIESGKRVERISLRWNDYLSFSIDEHLVLRKIAALDMFDEEFEGDDDENARLDADLFMTYSGLRRLLPELYQWFQVPDLEYDFGPGESTDEPEGDDDFSLPAMSDADDYQYEHPEQEEDEALVAANEE